MKANMGQMLESNFYRDRRSSGGSRVDYSQFITTLKITKGIPIQSIMIVKTCRMTRYYLIWELSNPSAQSPKTCTNTLTAKNAEPNPRL
jgi:hypothetical protein